MNSITNRQINIDLFSDEKESHFQYDRKCHVLPSMEKVHEFFQRQPFDTVKLSQDGKREYLNFTNEEVRVFDSMKTLRKTLSQENDGAWIEEKDGKKRYFIDDSGWFQTSFKQVSKKEYLQKLESPSTIQKALGIGLGILGLSPLMVEFARHLPKEMGMGLLALTQKRTLLAAFGHSLFPISVEAQAMGTEFQINTYFQGSEERCDLAGLKDGGFAVVWHGDGQDGSGNGIFGQRFAQNGSLVGNQFLVNTVIANDQTRPSITSISDGGMLIAWESVNQDGSASGVYAKRYDSSGQVVEDSFVVNSFTSGDQWHVDTAGFMSGYVITWESREQDGDLGGIYAKHFDSNNSVVGGELAVNSYMVDTQVNPVISDFSTNNFVVVWQSRAQDGSNYGVFAQKYFANSSKFGPEFRVNTETQDIQANPRIAGLQNGNFVIIWTSLVQDGSSWGIFSQLYDKNGTNIGGEFQVNTYIPNAQYYPDLAALTQGGFVVVWASNGQDGDGYGIYGQRLDENATFIGQEFQVNNFTTGDQSYPKVSGLQDGGFVVTWQSNGQDGSGFGIFGQRYDRNGDPVPLAYEPPISSATALSSISDTTNLPSSHLSLTSSSPTRSTLYSSSVSIAVTSSRGLFQTTAFMTTPSVQFESSAIVRSVQESTTTIGEDSLSSSSTISAFSTSGMQADTSSSAGLGIPALADVFYEQDYSVTQNGQTVGTFTITGGTGPYSSSNPNTLEIQFDSNYVLQEGDTFTLFSVPEGEEFQWEGIIFSGGEECFTAEGELVPNQDTNQNDYQLIFDVDEDQCSFYTDAPKLSAIPVLASGGLI